eukprot:TRINITY_DN55938_c0_g1_i1.p1 TRINITY_DN55938_c0_g1~~TRINITY_DN55938_c0_g1_i1.p1  ORF type:complete len:1134 (-),score=99.61 TRINITY_DN55938_c0_g1_i1:1206-4607(-)
MFCGQWIQIQDYLRQKQGGAFRTIGNRISKCKCDDIDAEHFKNRFYRRCPNPECDLRFRVVICYLPTHNDANVRSWRTSPHGCCYDPDAHHRPECSSILHRHRTVLPPSVHAEVKKEIVDGRKVSTIVDELKQQPGIDLPGNFHMRLAHLKYNIKRGPRDRNSRNPRTNDTTNDAAPGSAGAARGDTPSPSLLETSAVDGASYGAAPPVDAAHSGVAAPGGAPADRVVGGDIGGVSSGSGSASSSGFFNRSVPSTAAASPPYPAVYAGAADAKPSLPPPAQGSGPGSTRGPYGAYGKGKTASVAGNDPAGHLGELLGAPPPYAHVQSARGRASAGVADSYAGHGQQASVRAGASHGSPGSRVGQGSGGGRGYLPQTYVRHAMQPMYSQGALPLHEGADGPYGNSAPGLHSGAGAMSPIGGAPGHMSAHPLSSFGPPGGSLYNNGAPAQSPRPPTAHGHPTGSMYHGGHAGENDHLMAHLGPGMMSPTEPASAVGGNRSGGGISLDFGGSLAVEGPGGVSGAASGSLRPLSTFPRPFPLHGTTSRASGIGGVEGPESEVGGGAAPAGGSRTNAGIGGRTALGNGHSRAPHLPIGLDSCNARLRAPGGACSEPPGMSPLGSPALPTTNVPLPAPAAILPPLPTDGPGGTHGGSVQLVNPTGSHRVPSMQRPLPPPAAALSPPQIYTRGGGSDGEADDGGRRQRACGGGAAPRASSGMRDVVTSVVGGGHMHPSSRAVPSGPFSPAEACAADWSHNMVTVGGDEDAGGGPIGVVPGTFSTHTMMMTRGAPGPPLHPHTAFGIHTHVHPTTTTTPMLRVGQGGTLWSPEGAGGFGGPAALISPMAPGADPHAADVPHTSTGLTTISRPPLTTTVVGPGGGRHTRPVVSPGGGEVGASSGHHHTGRGLGATLSTLSVVPPLPPSEPAPPSPRTRMQQSPRDLRKETAGATRDAPPALHAASPRPDERGPPGSLSAPARNILASANLVSEQEAPTPAPAPAAAMRRSGNAESMFYASADSHSTVGPALSPDASFATSVTTVPRDMVQSLPTAPPQALAGTGSSISLVALGAHAQAAKSDADAGASARAVTRREPDAAEGDDARDEGPNTKRRRLTSCGRSSPSGGAGGIGVAVGPPAEA